MIFLTFLKILGYILVFILAAAVILILILLFTPFYFRIGGFVRDKKEGSLRFKWLFGCVRLNVDYKDEGLVWNLSYPFKKFLNKPEKKPKNKIKPKPENEASEVSPMPSEKTEKPPESAEVKSKPKVKKVKNNTDKAQARSEPEKNNENNEKEEKTSLTEKVKKIMSYENKTDIINCFVKNIKYMLDKLKFKVFKVRVLFGFSDPSLTGEALGLIYASGIALINGVETEADFTKAVFEAEADINGRGNLLYIIIPVIKFILNKNVRRILF